MKLNIGLRTDAGPREGQNQDSVLAYHVDGPPNVAILIVADGMGGARAGERASQEAVAVIKEALIDNGLPTADDAQSRLHQAVSLANAMIHEKSKSSAEMEGMGCTVVVALVIDDVYWIASVGDSRAYLIRNNETRQLTDDHTWVNARVREGLLTPEQAANHSLRHVLDRALGTEDSIEIDVWPDDLLEEGDTLVLCTDGVYGVLDSNIIAKLAVQSSADEAAAALIDQALKSETHDNASVVVLHAQ
jgi:serine/threonine protein phosphatase PrpC